MLKARKNKSSLNVKTKLKKKSQEKKIKKKKLKHSKTGIQSSLNTKDSGISCLAKPLQMNSNKSILQNILEVNSQNSEFSSNDLFGNYQSYNDSEIENLSNSALLEPDYLPESNIADHVDNDFTEEVISALISSEETVLTNALQLADPILQTVTQSQVFDGPLVSQAGQIVSSNDFREVLQELNNDCQTSVGGSNSNLCVNSDKRGNNLKNDSAKSSSHNTKRVTRGKRNRKDIGTAPKVCSCKLCLFKTQVLSDLEFHYISKHGYLPL